MSAHRVRVFFNVVTKDFRFTPERTYVDDQDGNATIVFLRDPPHNPGWEFVRVRIKNDDGQFDEDSNDGHVVVLHDRNTKEKEYDYTVTVRFDGREYESPDPQIINSGPVMMVPNKHSAPVAAIATAFVAGTAIGVMIGLAVGLRLVVDDDWR